MTYWSSLDESVGDGNMPPSPEPRAVSEARQRITTEGRLPENTDQIRPFFCRSCGKEEHATSVPKGWYVLGRSAGPYERHQRLGLYCRAACIGAQVPRLEGVERALGEAWVDAPSPYQS